MPRGWKCAQRRRDIAPTHEVLGIRRARPGGGNSRLEHRRSDMETEVPQGDEGEEGERSRRETGRCR